ncbi:MAG: glutaredoxin family protein [Gammaproteobacteria bacterium]|nr:hypothetical protein [Gammaproteobacteria bacterium]MBI80572.1 hypothetical protein [Gammaproteobacteria bacterium]RZO97454.1 MAG: hypothetical protein EVA53_02125 [Gammaproteobacteria bacterium]
MKEITLITGSDCPLCIEAKHIIDSIDFKDVVLVEKDIYSTRKIHDKYWDKIPVLLFDNKFLSWPFNQRKVKEFISL